MTETYAFPPRIMGWLSPNGMLSRDAIFRFLTFGQFGCSNGGVAENDLFVWAFPTSDADRAAGRICAYSGYWAAGHAIVYRDGLPFIDAFAPPKGRTDDNP